MNELEKLRIENKKLKQILKELGYSYFEEDLHLNKEDRLHIYLNYFKGRNDIFAKKFFHKKLQRLSYAFECQNKFVKNTCLLSTKKGKCNNECPYFKPSPLTQDIILNHIQKSNHTIGIYPILHDNTCYFLAIDFDDDLWFENMLCVYRIAKKYQLNCIMERSQSGHGGHLWFFFETAIKASIARKLGDFLLNEAMKTNRNLSFNSFDRMFPSQDFLSGAGFGNLIASPLQYDAVLKGNSVFINELQQVIKKPFHYLYSTPKIREEQINKILPFIYKHFKDYFDENDESHQLHIKEIIEEPLTLVENSLLSIPKQNLSAQTIHAMRRLASTYNPIYYEKLRRHKSVYDTSRVLVEYIENHQIIQIPRGLKSKLLEYIKEDFLTYEDQRCYGEDIDVSFKTSLRANQQEAVDTLCKYDIAILEAVPGFGKTVIALYLISLIKKSTLIIVPNKELLNQWKEKINEFLEYPTSKLKRDSYIGEYHGNKKKLNYHIDIALIQSLVKIEDSTLLEKYGLVIIDECHHASSNSYISVLRHLNAKYIYSFSGTMERKDKLDKIFYMYLGNVVYRTDKQELIANRTYEQILVPRMTTFKVIDEKQNYADILNELYQNQKRNYLIVQDIAKEMKQEKNIIVLTERKEHIDILYNELKYYDENIFCMSGSTSIKERKQIKEKITHLNHFVLIATSQLIGEGFDLPSLNTLFLTMPLSFKGRLSQYVGRLHRDYKNKTAVKVYDYVDINIGVLQNMFQKRLKTYKTEGYKTLEDNNIIEFNQSIFDKTNFEYYLKVAMNGAKKNIVILATNCQFNRIQKLYQYFISLLSNGIKIYIYLNKAYDETIIHYLDGISTRILNIEEPINGILIDETEFWSSSSSFLGVQYKDLYYLRTKDMNIIEELKFKIKEK